MNKYLFVAILIIVLYLIGTGKWQEQVEYFDRLYVALREPAEPGQRTGVA